VNDGPPGEEDVTLPLTGERNLRRRRRGYAVTTGLLALLMLLAAADAVEPVAIFGVDSAEARASGDGYDLTVRYAEVSRPALATPFEIEVHRDGGFDGPVTVAVDQDYVKLWDENGLYPAASSETSDGRWILWEFDPPDGDTLRIVYDARIEPAAQQGRDGAVAIVDDGVHVARVDFHTRIWP